jgi:hypothetical protein
MEAANKIGASRMSVDWMMNGVRVVVSLCAATRAE